MASNRKTQITPSLNQLDPLGSYYQYKSRYQQIAGAVDGENVDPHLQAYSLRSGAGPDVSWNLGRRLIEQDDNLNGVLVFPPASGIAFENFVRSTTKSETHLLAASRNYLAGPTRLYEDFVYTDGVPPASRRTSLPNKFAESLLFSVKTIIDELDEGAAAFGQTFPLEIPPDTYELNELQEYIRGWSTNNIRSSRFVQRLYRHLPNPNQMAIFTRFSQDDGEGRPQRTVTVNTEGVAFGRRGIFPTPRVTENFLDIIHYFTRGDGVERTEGDQGQYANDDAALVRQLYHFRIMQALIPEIPKSILKSILTRVTMPKVTCVRYNSDSAFVRTQKTYQEWDSEAFRTAAADHVRPHYSFYIPGYEKLVSGSIGEGIPEAALPNSYIRNLYFRNASPNYAQQIAKQVTLDSKIPERSTAGIEYYTRYTQLVPTARQDQVDISAELASLLLVPATAGNFLSARRGIPSPMSIEIAFRRSSWDSTVETIYDQGTSLPILRFLGDFYGSPYLPANDIGLNSSFGSKQPLVYGSQFISIQNGIQSTIPTTQQFDVFDARYVFRRPFAQVAGELVSPPLQRKFIVLSDSGPDREVWQRVEDGVPQPQTLMDMLKSSATAQAMQSKAERLADRAYNRVLNGSAFPSVALAYGLTKKTKKDNEIIQTIMFGNGAGSLNTSYYDTQVKYDTEYIYELDEFSLVYSPEYSVAIVCPNYPIWLMEQYLDLGSSGYMGKWTGGSLSPEDKQPELLFEMYVKEYPAPKIVRLPVHDHRDSSSEFSYGGTDSGLNGTSYPSIKILDRPPSPPSLLMLPLLGVDSQIKIHVNPNAGSFVGDNALEMVPIGGQENDFALMYQYQKAFINFELPEEFLEFQPEGQRETKNITIYRTTELNLNVDNYNDLYRAFNKDLPSVVTRRYATDPSDILEENIGIQTVGSYDITDNIRPNVNYYYTCVVEDRHGHISNPSTIFRVRLVSDKGLMIPEIDGVVPKRIRPQTPLKNLTRYLQIDASNIQSFPYFEQDSEGNIISAPNIASHLGKSLEDKAFIVRLTSKDTGRIFDIKLGFNIKYQAGEVQQGQPGEQLQPEGQPEGQGQGQGEGEGDGEGQGVNDVDQEDWDQMNEQAQQEWLANNRPPI